MITRRARLGVYTVWLVLLAISVACWGLAAWGAVEALGATKHCETRACYQRALAWNVKERRHLEHELARRRHVDLHAAIHLSSVLFGVPEAAMTCIARAESGYGRQTTPEPSSGALGPFQWLAGSWLSTPLGRAGYSRLDPLASSLSTAQRVVADRGWTEWVTARGCGL